MKKIVFTLLLMAFCSAVFSSVLYAGKKNQGKCKLQKPVKEQADYSFVKLGIFPHLNAE